MVLAANQREHTKEDFYQKVDKGAVVGRFESIEISIYYQSHHRNQQEGIYPKQSFVMH